jgi:hypothetical protein
MNNLTHAVEIAVSIRKYLREASEISPHTARELTENQEKITRQVKNITNLKK